MEDRIINIDPTADLKSSNKSRNRLFFIMLIGGSIEGFI